MTAEHLDHHTKTVKTGFSIKLQGYTEGTESNPYVENLARCLGGTITTSPGDAPGTVNIEISSTSIQEVPLKKTN